MKVLLIGAAVFLLAGFAGSDVRAQAAPPATKGKCYPNFVENCIKECVKGGGGVAGCPKWCESQKVARKCP
jgi:hypothetical protein